MLRKLLFILFINFLLSSCIVFKSTRPSLQNNNVSFYKINKIVEKYPQLPWDQFTIVFLKKYYKYKPEDMKFMLLKGGYSEDALFKVNLLSKNYILRFIGLNRPKNDRDFIIQSFVWAGSNNFGPKVYLYDKDSTFLLMDFLEGKTLELKDTKNASILKSLGKTLFKIHNAPNPKSNIRQMSQFTIGRDWYLSVKNTKRKYFGPSILKVAYNHWLKLNKEVNETSYKNSMLHNDPNLRNVLWNGKKIFLLDWELAGLADPRKELAHICAWYGLNDKLTDVFLSSYLKRKPSFQELLINEKMKKIILLEFAWVGLSSLKNHISINDWDSFYAKAGPKTVEDLSLIQINSESKPSDETLRIIYLGLIKQFIIKVTKDK